MTNLIQNGSVDKEALREHVRHIARTYSILSAADIIRNTQDELTELGHEMPYSSRQLRRIINRTRYGKPTKPKKSKCPDINELFDISYDQGALTIYIPNGIEIKYRTFKHGINIKIPII